MRKPFAFLAAAVLLSAQDHRVLLDAHNCYPYGGRFADRIERALQSGFPVAIEQDLAWHVDPATGAGKSVLSHEVKTAGNEPSMRDYFFERLRPTIEKELKDGGNRANWPIVVLNLDLKTNEAAHHEAVWKLLSEYQAWLTTAPRSTDPTRPEPLDVKPILVLTGSDPGQQRVFHDIVPVGDRLLVFGAVEIPKGVTAASPPAAIVPGRATNYRRWWNNPWAIVEQGGQKQAASWTRQDRARLRALVDHAHERGLWVRFYTLNGHPPAEGESNDWSKGYNFGTIKAAERRWRECIRAGVDFVATDQYEAFATLLRATQDAGGHPRRR